MIKTYGPFKGIKEKLKKGENKYLYVGVVYIA